MFNYLEKAELILKDFDYEDLLFDDISCYLKTIYQKIKTRKLTREKNNLFIFIYFF